MKRISFFVHFSKLCVICLHCLVRFLLCKCLLEVQNWLFLGVRDQIFQKSCKTLAHIAKIHCLVRFLLCKCLLWVVACVECAYSTLLLLSRCDPQLFVRVRPRGEPSYYYVEHYKSSSPLTTENRRTDRRTMNAK